MTFSTPRIAAPLLALTLFGCPDRGGPTGADTPPGPGGAVPEGPVARPAEPESWAIVAQENGTLQLILDRARIGDFQVHFYGKEWAWVGGDAEATGLDGTSPTFRMNVEGMGLVVEGRTDKTGPGEVTVTWTMKASRDISDVKGAAVEMVVQRTVAHAAGAGGEMTLLEDGAGWTWPLPDGKSLDVRFEPKLPFAYFEQGDKGRVRGVLFKDLAAGTHTQKMIVRLPAGGRTRDPSVVRFGAEDPASWHKGTLSWNRAPIDVRPALASVHHRPAGKHGRVEVSGESLQFADGTPARFWGTNVVAYSLFHAPDEEICTQADRLAAFGYNLVRLHHHDSTWVEPNVFVKGAATTQALESRSLARLDRWIECLASRGIYVWLDLHTGRAFRPGDAIAGWSELAQQEGGEAKGYTYVNPRIETLMHDFAKAYLGRRNTRTGVRYAEDPAVLGVLVTNENDMTQHHGNFMNSDAGHPEHRKMLRKIAAPFIAASKFHASESLGAWRPGEAKIVMTHVEHRSFERAIANIRAIGYPGPIATTNMWGDNRHWSLPSLTTGDVIDVHAYDGELRLEENPHHSPTFVHFIAAAQVEGKPLTVTEWNLPPPVRDRYVGPLWIAAMASLQGWDAPMHYAYSVTKLEDPHDVHQWSALYDPAQMALMPAAAVAFRLGHIKLANKTYRIELSRNTTYYTETSMISSAALRTLPEQSRVVIALPDIPEFDWDTPAPPTPGAQTVTDLSEDFLPVGSTSVTSDTGEIVRDWANGILTVDTPGSQWAVGWLGGKTITLGDVEIRLNTKHAAVALTALDGAELRTSKQILLTTIARAVPAKGPRIPFSAEPVGGTVSLASSVAGPLELVPLLRAHADPIPPSAPIAGRKVGKRWLFELPAATPTHWFLIRPAAG
ncbi:MAG: hypothetical protein JKY37_10310 [Nannocystaceae bacterium]|nr:hypothetical protein [Nannocystaceae bacterium]